MSLSIITIKNVKLKKDTLVWKKVQVIDEKEYPPFYCKKWQCVKSSKVHKDYPSLSMKNIPIITNIIIDCIQDKYDSGSHCFVNIDGTSIIHFGDKALPYIIPKNTVVTYGKTHGKEIIVTPKLINPRHPAHKDKYKHLIKE